MSVYVFLGPSHPLEQAQRLLDAYYLPPVAAGDVSALVERRPRAIVIIDGYFEQVPSVRHKEILYALSQGIRVFGSSSMGALRAAELHPYGMEGVGRIFEAYRSGEYEDDDEVAVSHAPESLGYRALSEAMVNVREGLRLAREAGVISPGTHDLLREHAKRKYYADRAWPDLWRAGMWPGVPRDELDGLRALVTREKPDLKREDAARLLEHVSRELAEVRAPRPPCFDFESTSSWRAFHARASRRGLLGVRDETLKAVGRHVWLFSPARDALLRSALGHHLMEAQAERLGIALSERDRGPAEQESLTDRWQAHADALTEAVLARSAPEVDVQLPLELLRRGEWDSTLAAVREKERRLGERGGAALTPQSAGVSVDTLREWFAQRAGLERASLAEYAAHLGLAEDELLGEWLAQYLLESPPPCPAGNGAGQEGTRRDIDS
ncbi:TfuA-like protein [Archangium violaceum]|uniref:TfuA-like protein n=1 Tax=Archangium violaceum TaxID=83451 RepID=UPI0007C790BE|nr:TfuA-like protein [Archangium violaceum]